MEKEMELLNNYLPLSFLQAFDTDILQKALLQTVKTTVFLITGEKELTKESLRSTIDEIGEKEFLSSLLQDTKSLLTAKENYLKDRQDSSKVEQQKHYEVYYNEMVVD